MRNWFFGLLSGVILTFVLLFFLAYVAVKIGSQPPSVRDATTLVLDLDGEIVEHNATELPARLFQRGTKPTLRQVVENVDKAAADSRVTGILVRPGGGEYGWAKANEIRAALLRFRQRGKKVYCHIVNASFRDYYVATACEKVYMQPVGVLDVKGMRAEAMFWRGTLEKIGARAQIVHTGPYKTYSNSFTEREMTPEHREMLNWLVDSLYDTALQAVAEARKKPILEVRQIVEAGPYEAGQAKTAGLIDDTLYEDQVLDLFKQQSPNKRLNRMTADRYLQVPAEDAGLRGKQKVAVLYAVGSIMRGDNGVDPLGGDQAIGSDSFGRTAREVADDSSVKAVILRVDSPGGDALASESIWRDLKNLAQKKPLVVSMSDVAGSGGYYIAALGAPIVADPNTLTASIGVVNGKIDIQGLYNKLGITKDLITRGPNSTLDSDYTPYTPEQWTKAQQSADVIYRAFKQRVADARKMNPDQVEQIAQGRVFTGEQAKQKGLVDELGGLSRAVEVVKEKAGIPKDEYVRLVPYPAPKSLFEILMERGQSAEAEARARAMPMPESLRAMMALRMFNGQPLTLMPFRLEFR